MFAQPRAVFAGSFGLAALVLFAGQAAGQSREELRERFREECRAQFPQLKGKAFAEERAAKVGPCVTAKFAAHTRGLAQQAAATPVTGRELKLLEYESWLTARARRTCRGQGCRLLRARLPQPTDLDTYLAGPYLIKSLSDNGWDADLWKGAQRKH